MDKQHILNQVKSYLHESVRPHAGEIDSNSQALHNALLGLAKLNVLALRVPKKWNGLEVSQDTFHNFQELVARYSGALAFLQTQHQSAAGMLMQSQNFSLKQEYLPRMSNGEILLGVGFSQLRRSGEQPIKVIAVEGGYQINGQLPWVTGFNLFQELIVAAVLPDNRAVFGIVPFRKMSHDLTKITFSQPMQLSAFTSTNTVTATFKNWFLPESHVVYIKPAGWIHDNDKRNVLNATGLVLGCASAGLDIVEAVAKTKLLPFISKAFELLNHELADCRAAIKNAQYHSEFVVKMQLRAQAIELAVRCAHAAVTVSSGAANLRHHPAQRVYREALVFTVSGQSTALMQATLARLVRSS